MHMSLCQRPTGRSSGTTKSPMDFVEFAREKSVLFVKWCTANGVNDNAESVRQLMLLEDFKSNLPEKLVPE